MIVVDANVLLYAVNADSRQHEPARAWLDAALIGNRPLGFSWVVLLAFLRLATSRSVFPRPLTTGEAGDVLETWLTAPAALVLSPTARHLAVLRGLLDEAGTAGNLVTDAHLAALAAEHGGTVASFDRDFGRFTGVRTLVPGA